MRYTAIDFETANASMLSACSIGLVVFEDGVPIHECITLIRPPEEFGKFNWYNVRIHGIKASMVTDAPTFDQIWPNLQPYIENQLVVCHNAAFDTVVLCRLLEYYGFPIPEFDYLCTVKVSQQLWPEMENHKLDTVCTDLDIGLNHHEALSDARACGYILAAALRSQHCTCTEDLLEALEMRIGHVSPSGRQSCSTSEEVRRKMIAEKKKQESRRRYYAHHRTGNAEKQHEKGDTPS